MQFQVLERCLPSVRIRRAVLVHENRLGAPQAKKNVQIWFQNTRFGKEIVVLGRQIRC